MTPLQIHVPKTGGTSIRKTIKAPPWSRDHVPLQHRNVQMTIRSTKDPYVFAFLRHPFDRAVSLYYFFVWNRTQGRERPKLTRPRSKAWIVSCIAQAAELDVNQFWKGLLRDDALQLERLQHAIVHFRHQHKWFAHESEPMVNYYDFGRFDEEVVRLCGEVGVAYKKPPHKMKSALRKHWSEELDEETQRLLRIYYLDDFEFLKSKGIEL